MKKLQSLHKHIFAKVTKKYVKFTKNIYSRSLHKKCTFLHSTFAKFTKNDIFMKFTKNIFLQILQKITRFTFVNFVNIHFANFTQKNIQTLQNHFFEEFTQKNTF